MNSDISISRKFFRIVSLLFFTIIIGIALVTILFFFIFSSHFDIGTVLAQQRLADQDDSNVLVKSFFNLLGSNWQTKGDIRRLNTDMRGYHFSIAGTSALTFDNLDNGAISSLFITKYSDTLNARERFLIQSEWIFDFDFGVPPSQQLFSYQDLNFVTNPVPNAQAYRYACKRIHENTKLIETRCGGLFLYNNYTVFVDTMTVKNGVVFLSQGDLEVLFSAVDSTMVSK